MRFLSICSGIEAASVAWNPLGWKAIAFAEIEKFPSAVLAHHYPDVPNLGDMTNLPERIRRGEVSAPDVLCGGTPCQAFSVAGLRRSLDDARGNLSLIFCEIADELDAIRTDNGDEPIVVFWENVPGVLNTKDNAFGCFLAGLAGEDEPLQPSGGKWTNAGLVLGPQRAVAWRVLDAQYFGVPQRRRRVFVVASARDGFDPAAVLFEFDGVRRDSAPSREAGEGVTGTTSARTQGGGGLGTDFECAGGLRPVITMAHGQGGAEIASDRSPTITCNHEAPIAVYPVQCITGDVTHTLKAEGFDASEDGTGRGQPIVVHGTQDPCSDEHVAFALGRNSGQENAIAFSCKDHGADVGEISPTLRSMGHDGSHANAGGQVAIASWGLSPDTFDRTGEAATGTAGDRSGLGIDAELAYALRAKRAGGVVTAMQVRRLTPKECARLQGFPDDYLDILIRGKPAADGPKYKALGNSWAVPCVRWIGRRIDQEIKRSAQ